MDEIRSFAKLIEDAIGAWKLSKKISDGVKRVHDVAGVRKKIERLKNLAKREKKDEPPPDAPRPNPSANTTPDPSGWIKPSRTNTSWTEWSRRRAVGRLDGATVTHSAQWIIDIKPAVGRRGADLPNGPFPANAYVPSSADYQGEIIIWIKDGHLDGLEFAWVSDQPPTRWPLPGEMEVVPG